MSQPITPRRCAATALLQNDPPRQLHKAIAWGLDTQLFHGLRAHGNTLWTFPHLILLALLWAWSDQTTLTGAFRHALDLAKGLCGSIGLTTYSGFIAALTTWTHRLIPRLRQRFQQRMAEIAKDHWRLGGWLPLAVDGSRTTTPRTRNNEKAFNRANFGRGRRAKSRTKWKNKRRRSKPLAQPVHPQIWLTLVWHMVLKMPWTWACGPSYASERQHLRDIVKGQEFPEKTLFCGDAGFVGYEFWTDLHDRGHHFLMRVGSNLRLLRKLASTRERGDRVYLWPNRVSVKQPPLVLRLLKFRTGRCQMFAVTNVLDDKQLTNAQAAQMYALRWGVELQFRSLKQTFGRSKLHSRTPERAYTELEWSLVGLWLVQLLMVSEQIPKGIKPEQSRVSVALQVVRDAMRRMAGGVKKGLRAAVKDGYERRRSKKARYRPQSKDKPSAGRPKIVNASATQRRKYRKHHG